MPPNNCPTQKDDPSLTCLRKPKRKLLQGLLNDNLQTRAIFKVLHPGKTGSIPIIPSHSCEKWDQDGFEIPKPIHVKREDEREKKEKTVK